jgi:hypothetical protein
VLIKTIAVDIVSSTFPGNTVPSYLPNGVVSIDVQAALHMLGSLTVPGGYSTASPARFWAQVRYLAAVSTDSDMRVIGPFVDLDPHQKTILSDDFGVAFSTKWLYDALGGVRDIVDGRKFLLQYSSLVRRPPRKKPPKVGLSKCPDFVALDHQGKWHVLECKGTQTSRTYRNSQLKDAYVQKYGIRLTKAVAGNNLAAGLFIGNTRASDASHMRVIDPPPTEEPLVVVDEGHRQEADTAARRIAAARAFGLSGLHETSEEVAVPISFDADLAPLFQAGELRRLRTPVRERESAAIRELTRRPSAKFSLNHEQYEGVQVTLEVPGDEFYANTGQRRVTIRQGISTEALEKTRSVQHDLAENVDQIAENFLTAEGVKVHSEENRVEMQQGRLFASVMEFHS